MEKAIFLITWSTKNSRIPSITRNLNHKIDKAIYLDYSQRCSILKFVKQVAEEVHIKIYSVNVLSNHVHMVIESRPKDLPRIVQKLKSKSTYLFKNERIISPTHRLNLWTKSYHKQQILHERQFCNAVQYVNKNHLKHKLPQCI